VQQTLLLLLGLCATACGGDEQSVPSPSDAPGSGASGATTQHGSGSRDGSPGDHEPPSERSAIDPANTGSIHGVVLFDGEAPERKQLNISGTAGCGRPGHAALSERVIVTDGKLANVFVYVRSGLETWELPGPSEDPVTLNQSGCIYAPHVTGIQVGQLLQVLNSDPTTHNVHVRSKRNDSFNRTQGPRAAALEYVFERHEVMVAIVCDIHPWMKCWIGVVDHPFHAVSKEDGTFAIEGLPAGEYTLSVWHEAFDQRKLAVTVRAGAEASVELRFP